MKGMVFTEFVEYVESVTSLDVAERMIQGANLENQGAYTSVGTYSHRDLLKMVTVLSQDTGLPLPELVRGFGRHLFGRLVMTYPVFLGGVDNAFDFIARVDNYVHVEVRKLYPDAELPRFETSRFSEDEFELIYHSSRPFADLAEGMILGCADWFQETISIERSPRLGNDDAVRFSMTRDVCLKKSAEPALLGG